MFVMYVLSSLVLHFSLSLLSIELNLYSKAGDRNTDDYLVTSNESKTEFWMK